jgi:hypothetical protein
MYVLQRVDIMFSVADPNWLPEVGKTTPDYDQLDPTPF